MSTHASPQVLQAALQSHRRARVHDLGNGVTMTVDEDRFVVTYDYPVRGEPAWLSAHRALLRHPEVVRRQVERGETTMQFRLPYSRGNTSVPNDLRVSVVDNDVSR